MFRISSLIRRGLGPLLWLAPATVLAGDADINLPAVNSVSFGYWTGHTILAWGLVICAVGAAFGLLEYGATRRLPVHRSMRAVSEIIWETCKTYLLQQGKFLAALWFLIALCMVYYFKGLQDQPWSNVLVILASSILGTWAATRWRGSASASTPPPTAARPSPRCGATRFIPCSSPCGRA